ncbi:MAG: hypothetical protein AAB316_19310, partial [Bacteroidota bacterium]
MGSDMNIAPVAISDAPKNETVSKTITKMNYHPMNGRLPGSLRSSGFLDRLLSFLAGSGALNFLHYSKCLFIAKHIGSPPNRAGSLSFLSKVSPNSSLAMGRHRQT